MATIESARQSLVGLGVNSLVSMPPTLLDALHEDENGLQLSPAAHAALQEQAVAEDHTPEQSAVQDKKSMRDATVNSTVAIESLQATVLKSEVCT